MPLLRESFTSWDGTPAGAIALQKRLREEVRLVPLASPPKLVAGCDVSMNMFAKDGYAGFVTLKYPIDSAAPEIIDHAVVKAVIKLPYIPGLLSFREIPMLLLAWEKLKERPDLILVDGLGVAHPRRLGIATHLGLELAMPTIGCGKSVLIGKYKEPAQEPGAIAYLYDGSEIIGAALRTKRGVKPMFISPGHLITLEESIEIVRNCVKKYRLPEPTRLAHNAVNEYRVRG